MACSGGGCSIRIDISDIRRELLFQDGYVKKIISTTITRARMPHPLASASMKGSLNFILLASFLMARVSCLTVVWA